MRFAQHVEDCGTHPRCTVISCSVSAVHDTQPDARGYEIGQVVWESHLDAAIHAAHRLNPDVPAFDHRDGTEAIRYAPPCAACSALLHPS